jgi:predicted DNA-binding transcriptional regulator AlpA
MPPFVDMNAHLSPSDRLLRAEELADLLGIGAKQFWRNESAGKIGPARVKFFRSRSVRFSHRETMAWLAERTAAGELLPRELWRLRWEAILASEQTSAGRVVRPTLAG